MIIDIFKVSSPSSVRFWERTLPQKIIHFFIHFIQFQKVIASIQLWLSYSHVYFYILTLFHFCVFYFLSFLPLLELLGSLKRNNCCIHLLILWTLFLLFRQRFLKMLPQLYFQKMVLLISVFPYFNKILLLLFVESSL